MPMNKLAEIRKRHDRNDQVYSGLGAVNAIRDRECLLDLVARMRSVLVEVVGGVVEINATRLDHVTVHLGDTALVDAIALLAETKAETIPPDLAPEGAVWVCLACGDYAKDRPTLKRSGCELNVYLCVDDKPAEVMGSQYYWRPYYEPRG